LHSPRTRVDFQSINSEELRVVQVNLLRIDEKRPTVRKKREESAVHCKSGNKIF